MSRTRAVVALTALAIAGAALPALASQSRSQASLSNVRHVFVIVLENQPATTSFGPSSPAPYLASTLVGKGAYVPNYYGTAHHSLPNYIAMISGQAPTAATQADCGTFSDVTVTAPPTGEGQVQGNGCVYPASVQTLAGQLDGAGFTWKGYMDSMGANTAREAATCAHPTIGAADGTQAATAADQYATRHNPFMYFHSIIDNQGYCDAHVVPLTRLAGDLASASTTPNLVFISPSLCNDGHDAPCANGQPGGLTQVNTFLQSVVPQIEASAAYKADGLIAIIFDESEGGDAAACCGEQSGPNVAQAGGSGPGGGRTGAVLLSPFITGGTTTSTAYNHYSLLRSIEDAFGLARLGYAAQSGLTAFGTDVFAQPSSGGGSSGGSGGTTSSSSTTTTTAPSVTTTTTTTSVTTTTTKTTTTPVVTPLPCVARSTGAVAYPITRGTLRGSPTLLVKGRRAGTLTFTITPTGKPAGALKTRTLVACKTQTIRLPAGHGTVRLVATAGKRKDVKSVSY